MTVFVGRYVTKKTFTVAGIITVFKGGGCKFSFDLETFHRYLRSVCTVCGAFSLFFLAITLFLYLTLPDLNNFQVKCTEVVVMVIVRYLGR